MVGFMLADNVREHLPVFQRLGGKKVVFILQRPPYVSVSGKTVYHVFPVEGVRFLVHHAEAPAVIGVHDDDALPVVEAADGNGFDAVGKGAANGVVDHPNNK